MDLARRLPRAPATGRRRGIRPRAPSPSDTAARSPSLSFDVEEADVTERAVRLSPSGGRSVRPSPSCSSPICARGLLAGKDAVRRWSLERAGASTVRRERGGARFVFLLGAGSIQGTRVFIDTPLQCIEPGTMGAFIVSNPHRPIHCGRSRVYGPLEKGLCSLGAEMQMPSQITGFLLPQFATLRE